MNINDQINILESLKLAKFNYYKFLKNQKEDIHFKFTPNGETNPFSTLFGIFGLNFVGQLDLLNETEKDKCADSILNALKLLDDKISNENKIYDKHYMQLLCFSFSGLFLLKKINSETIDRLVKPIKLPPLEVYLQNIGAWDCVPQSGNKAMFYGILLILNEHFLNKKSSESIEKWVQLHLDNINQFGFWGKSNKISFLQFQNGYHQHEIFHYLNINPRKSPSNLESILSLVDNKGHFAPYAGGGGCYDFDAIFLITTLLTSENSHAKSVLELTLKNILNEQNPDGGFCENKYIRSYTFEHLIYTLLRPFKLLPNWTAFQESLFYTINLQRPKHKLILTHWGDNHRKWSESNTWDSWFRMMSIAKMAIYLNISKKEEWGFINFPGIGFHR